MLSSFQLSIAGGCACFLLSSRNMRPKIWLAVELRQSRRRGYAWWYKRCCIRAGMCAWYVLACVHALCALLQSSWSARGGVVGFAATLLPPDMSVALSRARPAGEAASTDIAWRVLSCSSARTDSTVIAEQDALSNAKNQAGSRSMAGAKATHLPRPSPAANPSPGPRTSTRIPARSVKVGCLR